MLLSRPTLDAKESDAVATSRQAARTATSKSKGRRERRKRQKTATHQKMALLLLRESSTRLPQSIPLNVQEPLTPALADRVSNVENVLVGMMVAAQESKTTVEEWPKSEEFEVDACEWGPWQCAEETVPASVLQQQCGSVRRLQTWWRQLREQRRARLSLFDKGDKYTEAFCEACMQGLTLACFCSAPQFCADCYRNDDRGGSSGWDLGCRGFQALLRQQGEVDSSFDEDEDGEEEDDGEDEDYYSDGSSHLPFSIRSLMPPSRSHIETKR